MSFTIQKATRAGLRPLVGFYGKSGSGKTMSALLFARGLVGPHGKIVMIDSENGRGSIFSDIIPGGYDILNLDAPFSPDRYHEAIEVADKVADCIVIDSFSHEWSGEAGVLDSQEAELQRMAGDDYKRRESCKMASWIKPKMAHKKLVGRVLRCRAAMIVCLRGEEKTHMERGADGKNKVSTDEFSSPIADPRFIFEMLVNFETVAKDGVGGFVIPRKITHPAIREFMPRADEQIKERHGQLLGQWCAAPAGAPAVSESKSPVHEAGALLGQLRDATYLVHQWKKSDGPEAWKVAKLRLQQWLWDEAVMSDTESLADVSVERLAKIINKAKEKLTP